MDEKRTDWKAAIRELAAEEATDLGPHVGLKRLTAYRQGTLPAAEREAVQDHLSRCKKCSGLLLELRDFEAAAARGDAAGPESLQEEAWESLARQLPQNASAIRPITGAGRPEVPRQRRLRYFLYGAAAALLAVVGPGLWLANRIEGPVFYRGSDGPDIFEQALDLQKQLEKREEELTAARRSLAEAERHLAAARRRIEGLEKRSEQPARVAELEAQVAELASALEKLRRSPQAPDERGQTAVASRPIEVSVAPRFTLRGQEPPGGVLQGGGAVNSVQPKGNRFTVALSLADHPAYGDYRLELMNRLGKVLWADHRPGAALLGDAGTKVSVAGLGPGRYRLRIEGLRPNGSDLLAEYVLEVEAEERPQ